MIIYAIAFFFSFNLYADSNYQPKAIYKLDSRFTHHVIVVEKSTHSLFIYKNNNGSPELLKKYRIATGKMTGDKDKQGDKKTPEGIYLIQDFYSAKSLLKRYGKHGLIYGAGAFPLSFPNEMDRREKKTGGGIWLHSTDDDSRVDKGLDSRGCVVATDMDIKEIAKYIELQNTQVIITEVHNFQTQNSWQGSKDKILATVNGWAKAWQEKDFKSYINSYSNTEFFDHRKGGYNSYKKYKRAVFARKDKPLINFDHISVLRSHDYVVVTMKQDYSSDIIKDTGKKTLYLKLDENYEWKIVAEQWSKIDELPLAEFRAEQKFFVNPDVTTEAMP